MTECSRRATTTTRFTEHGFKSKIKVKEDTPVYFKKKDQNEWKSRIFPKTISQRMWLFQILNPMKIKKPYNAEYDTPTIQEDLSEKLKI